MNATKFINQKWVSNLAFLVDLASHLNLNWQLQEKLQLMPEMWSYVRTFDRTTTLGYSVWK